MTQESLTLYKLIILYMLNRVDFPLTRAQITDFILGREYTSFMNLQQAFAQLIESGLLSERTFRNRTQLFITEEGLDTLRFFENRISQEIKKDIDSYLQEKSMSLKKEISITSDYRRQGQQNYKAHLAAWENGAPLIDLTFSVPSEDIASAICINWEEKNEEIYQYLVAQLF